MSAEWSSGELELIYSSGSDRIGWSNGIELGPSARLIALLSYIGPLVGRFRTINGPRRAPSASEACERIALWRLRTGPMVGANLLPGSGPLGSPKRAIGGLWIFMAATMRPSVEWIVRFGFRSRGTFEEISKIN